MKHIVLALLPLVLLSACSREESSTYEVPKEASGSNPHQSMPQAAPMMGSQTDNEMVQAAHAAMSAQMPATGFEADLPEGWEEKPGSGMRKASWSIEGTSIDFYLISLSMGDVPSNVNRWRGQIGLDSASPEEVAAGIQTFQADGHTVSYTELYNEEGGKGIIAAIVDLSPSYWYFTAKGAVDELKAHSADIRKFIESVKFEGHNH